MRAPCRSRVPDALQRETLLRRAGTVAKLGLVTVPVLQRTAMRCAAPGTQGGTP